MKKQFHLLFALLVVFTNIGCDQLSKNIAREHLDAHASVPLVDGHFTLIKVENTGAFLSLGASWAPWIKQLLLLGLPIACLAAAFGFLLLRPRLHPLTTLGLGGIIGGGAGNLYDRVLYGSVTDFMHLDFGIFETGIFNMADVSIMLGTLLVLLAQKTKGTNYEL
jgi:signal peptidase II